MEKKITTTIIDDKKIERDESFQLNLSAGEGVHLTPFSRAEITIINNDGKDVHINCHESKFCLHKWGGGVLIIFLVKENQVMGTNYDFVFKFIPGMINLDPPYGNMLELV